MTEGWTEQERGRVVGRALRSIDAALVDLEDAAYACDRPADDELYAAVDAFLTAFNDHLDSARYTVDGRYVPTLLDKARAVAKAAEEGRA